MYDKSSWRKYGVYHFNLHDDCVYLKKNLFQIKHHFINKLRANLQSNNLDAYI